MQTTRHDKSLKQIPAWAKIHLYLAVWTLSSIFVSNFVAFTAPCFASSQPKVRYLGLEFFGSSQVSQLEIEKFLGLKTGSYVTNPVKNIEKLNNELTKRNLEAIIELVPQGDDSFFLAVDIVDHNANLP
ncbi:MAG: hypothetical protein K2Q33_01555, partial [Gammaproteobacteria bacterium]|nr:hypothetical protein [Gammaproteobacteria bacterium]